MDFEPAFVRYASHGQSPPGLTSRKARRGLITAALLPRLVAGEVVFQARRSEQAQPRDRHVLLVDQSWPSALVAAEFVETSPAWQRQVGVVGAAEVLWGLFDVWTEARGICRAHDLALDRARWAILRADPQVLGVLGELAARPTAESAARRRDDTDAVRSAMKGVLEVRDDLQIVLASEVDVLTRRRVATFKDRVGTADPRGGRLRLAAI